MGKAQAPGVRYQERGKTMRKYLMTQDYFDHAIWQEKTCVGCDQNFKAGQFITLLNIGPGGDEEERELAREGLAYTAVAIPVHWACVTGELDITSLEEEINVRSVSLEVEDE